MKQVLTCHPRPVMLVQNVGGFTWAFVWRKTHWSHARRPMPHMKLPAAQAYQGMGAAWSLCQHVSGAGFGLPKSCETTGWCCYMAIFPGKHGNIYLIIKFPSKFGCHEHHTNHVPICCYGKLLSSFAYGNHGTDPAIEFPKYWGWAADDCFHQR